MLTNGNSVTTTTPGQDDGVDDLEDPVAAGGPDAARRAGAGRRFRGAGDRADGHHRPVPTVRREMTFADSTRISPITDSNSPIAAA